MPSQGEHTRAVTAASVDPSMRGRLSQVTLLILDVDGVLTDGGIFVGADGSESRRFDVKDGLGIVQWRRAGNTVAFLSGRCGSVVEHRARELGVDRVVQGCQDKAAGARRLCADIGVRPDQALMMGDDLPDMAAFNACGVSAAPADAVAQVRSRADIVVSARGGHGAVRELIDILLEVRRPAAVGVCDGEVIDGRVS
ncbi:MAG: HAD hydrolase family protein [Planctomycetota bacterium]|nr:HAD hydrolase family protein [Planctomycetota bacterium]MDA1105574.1 HAD hydrolase family protein [Planctomycetota bacterium]